MVALETERLLIRQFELSDDDFVLRLLNEESFLNFIGDKGVRTLKDARHNLRDGHLASYAAHGFGLFLVAEKFAGDSVGMCGLLKRDNHYRPDIGFAFLSEFQSKGCAYESAEAVMAFGHGRLKIGTIVGFVDPDNDRSIRLLERLGLHFVGEAEFGENSSPTSLYRSCIST